MIKKFNIFNEVAEYVNSDELYTNWTDDDAITFSYVGGEMYVSVRGHENTHYGLSVCSGNYYTRFDSNMVFPGRLWEDRKIISFWKYPKPEELNKVLRDIEKKYKEEVFIFDDKRRFYFEIKIFNDELYVYVNSKWLKVKKIINTDDDLETCQVDIDIDYIKSKIKPSVSWYSLFKDDANFTNLILESKFDLNITNDWYINIYDNDDNTYKLIPISEYIGSDNIGDEELKISHTDNPQEKERKRQLLKQQGKEITGYFKSKYDVPAKFDYYRRKYMFQEKFSNFK